MTGPPVPNVDGVPGALKVAFPEYGRQIDALMTHMAEYGGVIDYRLISEVFRWEILKRAMATGNPALLRDAYAFIERLLGSPDQSVRDATEIRIVPHMLQDPTWSERTRQLAGPLLRGALDREEDAGDT
ncbi:DUF7674 family protein [Kribbella lupini]|uniref:DUF7674 domain-containing protein n=1 Tax=Kribbella lupini TaxID=291602 RepID=A0ABP4LQR4_9ACTN